MADITSKITTSLAVDEPVEQTAALRTDKTDRRKIDNQILGLEQHLVDSLISGQGATWFRLSSTSPAVIEGDCVCAADEIPADKIPVVTKAFTAKLADAKSVVGVVSQAATPGGRVRVAALGGMLLPELTGLALNAPGAVRVNGTTARCERVDTFGVNDYPVGTVTTKGVLNITSTVSPGLQTFVAPTNTFTLAGTSAALVSGDWVCLNSAGGGTTVTKATPAALALAGSALGIVNQAWNPGDTISLSSSGDSVSAAITGLAADGGNRSFDATVDANARTARIVRPNGDEVLVGTAHASGKLTIATKSVAITAPVRTFNPKTYGCLWNGFDDDLPGLNAMFAAMGSAPSNIGAEVHLPEGTGYIGSGNLRIEHPCRITGRAGGTGYLNSRIKLAPGKSIILDGATTSVGGGTAYGTVIEHVDITSLQLVRNLGSIFCINDFWVMNTAYPVGYALVATGGATPTLYFEASGGTSGGVEPVWPTTPGSTIVDGTITWTVRKVLAVWQANHAYVVGSRVYNPNNNRYYFEATAIGGGGLSGGTYPANFDGPSLGLSIVDNQVTWLTKTHNALLFKTTAHVNHVLCTGFTNACFHIQAGAAELGATNANQGSLRNTFSQQSGLGIYLGGSDANGWSIEHFASIGLGQQQSGTGGNGLWDHSQGGCKASGGSCESATGAAIRNDGNISTFTGCSTEANLANQITFPASQYGGDTGGPLTFFPGDALLGPGGPGLFLSSVGGQGIVEINPNHPTTTLQTGLTIQSTVGPMIWFSSADEGTYANQWGWRYQFAAGNGQTAGTGQYAFSFGNQNSSLGLGVTGALSSLGTGMWIDYRGHYCGDSSQYFDGADVAALTDKRVRAGHQLVGDRFAVIGTGVAGTWNQYIVKTAGYRALHWQANIAYRQAYAPWGIPDDMVEPTANALPIPVAGSKVFKVFSVVGDQKSGAVEPDWSGAVLVGDAIVDHNVTWHLVGFTPDYNYGQFVDDPIKSIVSQVEIDWFNLFHVRSKQATTTTANATPAVLHSYALPDTKTTDVSVIVTAGSGSNGMTFGLSGAWRRNGGAPIEIRPPTVDRSDTTGPTWTAVLALNGNNVEVQITGQAATTIAWECVRQGIE